MPEPLRPSPVSRFVESAVERLALCPGQSVLDLGCGGGRHSLWLATQGHRVVAADLDADRLHILARCETEGALCRVRLDAARELPFKRGSFDLILVVHLVLEGLLERLPPYLREGGRLVYETFGTQGENWRQLPVAGNIRESLERRFSILHYHERSAGPAEAKKVAVRAVGLLK